MRISEKKIALTQKRLHELVPAQLSRISKWEVLEPRAASALHDNDAQPPPAPARLGQSRPVWLPIGGANPEHLLARSAVTLESGRGAVAERLRSPPCAVTESPRPGEGGVSEAANDGTRRASAPRAAGEPRGQSRRLARPEGHRRGSGVRGHRPRYAAAFSASPSRPGLGDSARVPQSRGDETGRSRLGKRPATRHHRTTLQRKQPAHVAKPPVRSEGSFPHLPPQFFSPRRWHLRSLKDNLLKWSKCTSGKEYGRFGSIKLPFPIHLEPPHFPAHTHPKVNSRPPRMQPTLHDSPPNSSTSQGSSITHILREPEQVWGKGIGNGQWTAVTANEPHGVRRGGRKRQTFANRNGKKYPRQYLPLLTDVNDRICIRWVPGSRPPHGQNQEQGENFHLLLCWFSLRVDFLSRLKKKSNPKSLR